MFYKLLIFLLLPFLLCGTSYIKSDEQYLIDRITSFLTNFFYESTEFQNIVFTPNRICFITDDIFVIDKKEVNVISLLLKSSIITDKNIKDMGGKKTLVDPWGNPYFFILNGHYLSLKELRLRNYDKDDPAFADLTSIFLEKRKLKNGKRDFLDFENNLIDHKVDYSFKNSSVIALHNYGLVCISAGKDGKITNLIAFDYCTDKWNENFELISDDRNIDCDNDNVYSSDSSSYANSGRKSFRILKKMYHREIMFGSAILSMLFLLIGIYVYFKKNTKSSD